MKLLIQRVNKASIRINDWWVQTMHSWIVVYVWFTHEDSSAQLQKAAERIVMLPFFEDETGKIKHSLSTHQWSLLLVPNFTLYGRNKKWNQLDYTHAAPFQEAESLFKQLCTYIQTIYPHPILIWEFWAYMEITATNTWPVNIFIDI